MRPPVELLFPPEIGAQLIYSFIIIVCSLMIYQATREIYELSTYKGIKYFRQAFLYFAVAYFFNYFIKFFLVFFDADVSPMFIFAIPLFIFLYSSSMAIFNLLYSVMWKKWNHSKLKVYLLNFFALLIASIGTIFRGIGMQLILNVILLAFVSFVLLTAYKDSENKQKGKGLLIIYQLLFIFWVLNVIDVIIPKFLHMFQLIIYLTSISLFMVILYKVLRKAGT